MQIIGVQGSQPKSVPNAPTIGTATDQGSSRAYNNGQASVTFTAPSFDGKLPITSYTVTSSPGGFTGTGASSPITVAGLQSATAYTFAITAANSIGTSSSSSASNSITATTVPQAPQTIYIPSVTAGQPYTGSANVTVAFMPLGIVTNPTFESQSTSGYAAAAATLSTSNLYSYGGTYSMSHTILNSSDTNIGYWSGGTLPQIGNYAVTAWFYLPTGSTLAGKTIGFSYEGSGSPTLVSSSPATLVIGQWVQARAVYTFSYATTVGPFVARLSVLPSTVVGQVFYSDNWGVDIVPGGGGNAIIAYTVTSTSGNTGSSTSSPITISETVGTSPRYTVTAINANGTSSPSASPAAITPASVPQAPTIGTATAGNGSATVTYTAGATGGSAVTSYTATASPGGATGTGASPITVSGLTNGTAYTFTVTATNAQGTSAASSASNSVTPVTVPGAPTIGTATDVGSGRAYNNGRADVTFSAPASNGGSAITSYTVKVYDSGGTYQSNASSGAGSPITLTGLASNTAYKYTVYATNAQGNSAESGFSNLVTATTIPQAPTIGTATNSGSGRAYNNGLATVAYTANGTGGLTNTYTATSSPSSFTGTGGSPISVSGLASGTAYTFTVTASNSNGSATSSASNSITATTIPQAPTIGTATKTGSTTATLTYTANGTGGLTNTYSVNGGGSGSGASPISITGLSPGTAYSFSVTATNSNGTATSGTSNSITTANPPSSVTYLVVAGGAGGCTGGGGAGGVRTGTLSVSGGTGYTLTVGGGGASAHNGNNSVFSSITSTGGGTGGNSNNPGTSGGSGGGGGCGDGSIAHTNTGGAGTAGQGNNGGSSSSSSVTGAGGGGGAGAVGATVSTGGEGGVGGNGTASSISGSSVTYGGGGGGSPYNLGFVNPAGGGTGGGGRGNSWVSPYNAGNQAYTAGTTNTGGGGGGNNDGAGKAGGSGIVIISYTNTYSDLTSITGLTYTGPVNTGGNKVYTFTAGTGTVTI